ncbi:MAG: sulfur carrier protein ThiS [Rikenellaceae bacterium]|jgi:sulfur carrier protein|nr:sulfur carrier protein ThiS [Rikenellaceae bacterium]
MEVFLNNEKITTGAATLAELIAERLPETGGVAVALGSSVVPRGAWGDTPLSEGCSITIIRATRGG